MHFFPIVTIFRCFFCYCVVIIFFVVTHWLSLDLFRSLEERVGVQSGDSASGGERGKDAVDIRGYGISMTTLEEVFMRIGTTHCVHIISANISQIATITVTVQPVI